MISKKANTEYTLLNEIESRWSPRMFSDKEISDHDLMRLFEAARWSASSNNYQPWRFTWARKGSTTWDKIFSCLSDFNKDWVTNAPVLILTAFKKKFDNGKENFHALHDLGLAVGNFSIQAQNQGIGVHQMAGVDWEKAHHLFNIPNGYHITTAIAVGYYGGDATELPEDLESSEKKDRNRKKLDEIVGKDNFPMVMSNK